MTGKAYAHFIGAGGAGMSGIALVLHRRGRAVTGSDLKESRYSKLLAREGVEIAIGHAAENLGDPEVVVVSSAIPETNPELAEARRRGLPVWQRARMLAELAEDRATVAVAGTHGKTTTSSMIATMLARMGLDPTFLIGGEVDGFETNAHAGTGPHYVVEADESDGSFVHLSPDVALITNIEADHLDHYADLAEIERTFAQFMERVKPEGTLVVWAEDAPLIALAQEAGRRMVTYGESAEAEVRFSIMRREGARTEFAVRLPDGSEHASACAIPGDHMVCNAAGALATAWALGLDVGQAAEALSSFTGVRRRFDLVGEVRGVTIVDDYAHHPTEVKATLHAARQLGHARTWVLFQPHRYSRTEALAREFGEAFGDADAVVLMDVYSAGEVPIPGVTGKTIVDSVLRADGRARVVWLPHRGDVATYLCEQVRAGDLVLTMGAGDVTSMGSEIIRTLSDDGDEPCR